MKKILFLLILISTFKINAQTVFLPNIGTTWHYLFGQYAPTVNKFNVKIEYVKDTVYGGDLVKVLTADRIYNVCNIVPKCNVYIKQKNDSIWFLHSKTNNSWQLLIDFNSSPGESWKFNIFNSSNAISTYTVKVNSVSTNTINNFILKTLNVTYTPSNLSLSSYTAIISERIGDMSYLFNMANIQFACDLDYVEALLCYSDSTFGSKQFTPYSCDYQYMLGVNENIINTGNIKIYPNPVRDKLNLEFSTNNGENSKLNITNSFGQVVYSLMNLNMKQEINISDLGAGIYFIKIQNNSEQKVFKVIKE